MTRETCPDEGCMPVKCMTDAIHEIKETTSKLVDGQHQLDKSLATLTESVVHVQRMGERLEKLENRVITNEKNLWKIIGAFSVMIPMASMALPILLKGLTG